MSLNDEYVSTTEKGLAESCGSKTHFKQYLSCTIGPFVHNFMVVIAKIDTGKSVSLILCADSIDAWADLGLVMWVVDDEEGDWGVSIL